MTAIRRTQRATFHPQSSFQLIFLSKTNLTFSANYTRNFLDHQYRAKPFASAGIFSILQSFCPRTVPTNEQGFSIFPNGTFVLQFT